MARGIRRISLVEVLADHRDRLAEIHICRIDGIGGLGFLRLLGESFDLAVFIDRGYSEFPELIDIFHSDGDERVVLLLFKECIHVAELIGEEVVTGDDHHVLIDRKLVDNELDVADRAEFICIVGRAVIDNDDRCGELAICDILLGTGLRPFVEVAGKAMVGYYCDPCYVRDGLDFICDVVDHGLRTDRKKRLRCINCQRIKTRGISGCKNQSNHVYPFPPILRDAEARDTLR